MAQGSTGHPLKTRKSHINVSGTFYYLCSVLDGYSRAIVHWDLRQAMKETGIEIVLQAAKENYPGAKPRIISDNGPRFIARDFKEFIRISGMTHVRTSPYYPQLPDGRSRSGFAARRRDGASHRLPNHRPSGRFRGCRGLLSGTGWPGA